MDGLRDNLTESHKTKKQLKSPSKVSGGDHSRSNSLQKNDPMSLKNATLPIHRGRPRKEPNANMADIRAKILQVPEIPQFASKTMYQLGRHWMLGSNKKHVIEESDNTQHKRERSESPDIESIDLLTSKKITELPSIRKHLKKPDSCPKPFKFLPKGIPQDSIKVSDYQKHWSRVRNSWLEHNKLRYARHNRSIQTLETCFLLGTQNLKSVQNTT
uniref:EOG090X0GO7 n=1 Tax=Rhabditophanes sp. KR3021 TaxID=114890 RepID=A0AC35UHT4_9BILA